MGSPQGIRILGGIIIWLFKGLKVPLNDCINKNKNAFVVGCIVILVAIYLVIYIASFF